MTTMKTRDAMLMAQEKGPRWKGPRKPSRLFGQKTLHKIGIPLCRVFSLEALDADRIHEKTYYARRTEMAAEDRIAPNATVDPI